MVRREGGQDSVGRRRVKGDCCKVHGLQPVGFTCPPHPFHPAPLNPPAGTPYTGPVPPGPRSFTPNETPTMRFALPLALLACSLPMTARADEGMWLLNDPPRDHLKAKYGFDLTDAWLPRAQK